MSEISIIVPIHNTEQYLKRCLDSILKQSFQDFSLILVDNGYTDDLTIKKESLLLDSAEFIINTSEQYKFIETIGCL